MTERIWDDSVLDTTEGTFELAVKVSERFNLPKNQDGSDPEMTVKVQGETLRTALSGARTLGQNEDYIVEGMLTLAMDRFAEGGIVPETDEYAALREALKNDTLMEGEDETPELHQFLELVEEYTGWEHSTLELELEINGKQQEVSFDMHTPGYTAAILLLQKATSDKTLSSIVANAMPLASEYDEDDYDDDYDDYDDDFDDED